MLPCPCLPSLEYSRNSFYFHSVLQVSVLPALMTHWVCQILLRLRDMAGNERWLEDTLVIEENRALYCWGITRIGIKGSHFTAEDRRRANVHREARDFAVACNIPFDPLRVKGAPRRGRKKKRVAFDDKGSEGWRASGAGPTRPVGPFEQIETEMASIKELLRGFPKPPLGDRRSNIAAANPEGVQVAIASLA
ncbi:hypothetical protein HAX54_028019 [Datura stramonium]|uniref:Uncharacterized protein n=1 Tax=Datura stramonium TaxID=4076 RepID=A0ABS8V4M5_DATST|nr:hypothetical protein [Datura stramonium]